MRFQLPVGRTLLFLFLFLLALIALVPMRLGLGWLDLDERGVATREARGSVWNGELIEAELGKAQIGNVDAGLEFFPLLIGRTRLGMKRDARTDDATSPDEFRGILAVSGSDFGIEELTVRLPVSQIFAPLPVTRFDLEDLTAHFEGGLCSEAEGGVRMELRDDLDGIALPATATGTAQCENGALLLPMIGQSGMEQVNLRVESNGAYSVEILLRPGDTLMQERMIAAGFRPTGNGYALTMEGRL